MIVRILNEDVFELGDEHHAELDRLDDVVVAKVEGGDEAGFVSAFEELLAFVRQNGAVLADDDLRGSDHILPPADLTFAEAGEQFSGEGLIPDPPAA